MGIKTLCLKFFILVNQKNEDGKKGREKERKVEKRVNGGSKW